MYSQNDEEKWILEYFGNRPGRFYDIGAWSGKELSNTRALLECGWTGVMVEPEAQAFQALMANTREFAGQATLVNVAIARDTSLAQFWSSHGDAVSTLSREHMELWDEAADGMRRYFVKPIAPAELFAAFGPAEFISLDVEGTNMEILRALPFEWPELRMICVEYEDKLDLMRELLAGHGFETLHATNENLIAARR